MLPRQRRVLQTFRNRQKTNLDCLKSTFKYQRCIRIETEAEYLAVSWREKKEKVWNRLSTLMEPGEVDYVVGSG